MVQAGLSIDIGRVLALNCDAVTTRLSIRHAGTDQHLALGLLALGSVARLALNVPPITTLPFAYEDAERDCSYVRGGQGVNARLVRAGFGADTSGVRGLKHSMADV